MRLSGGRFVSTDDASSAWRRHMVSADVSGPVSEVLVHEDRSVRRGDVLAVIDPREFLIAIENRKAQLAQSSLDIEAMKQTTSGCSSIWRPRRLNSNLRRRLTIAPPR
jgi:membrane fusion protein (multidrug efflux system)